MKSSETCRLYEKPALREAGGGLIRPGGLELTMRAVALSGLCPGSLLLDIGCGTGAALRCLAETGKFRVVGIDLSSDLLAEGRRKNPELSLSHASGAALPFADGSMDAVLAECSLSAMEDVEAALDGCARILKLGGLLLVHDVYARAPHGKTRLQGLPVKTCLTGAVSKDEWMARLESRGFTVTLWEDHSSALKEFAARLIFSCGSLEMFWNCSGSASEVERGRQTYHTVSSAKPGYFLALAKKAHSVRKDGER